MLVPRTQMSTRGHGIRTWYAGEDQRATVERGDGLLEAAEGLHQLNLHLHHQVISVPPGQGEGGQVAPGGGRWTILYERGEMGQVLAFIGGALKTRRW